MVGVEPLRSCSWECRYVLDVGSRGTYCAVDDMLIACVVIDVYCDASKCRDFRGQLIQSRVVLLLALVGLRHGYAMRLRLLLVASGCEGSVAESGVSRRRKPYWSSSRN
jgi:hypothetical protein